VDDICSEDFAERVRLNQSRLSSEMKSHYDFIICGSGSSGSVVARRLAENPEVSVLLIEAGGEDNVPSVNEPGQWFLNLGSERDWNFQAEPSPHLNGRAIPMNMGRILGGGSSINVMAWMRGHKNDWDFFATEAGDPAWSYESILGIYRRIEDWRGAPDPDRRGVGGPVFVQPAPNPHPIASATLEGARSVGIPTFDSPNGRMMKGAGGCSIMDLLIRNARRQSVFRAYTFPYMDRPNLTVLTQTQVIKVTFEGRRATGVELVRKGKHFRIGAGREIVPLPRRGQHAQGAHAFGYRRPIRPALLRHPDRAASSGRRAKLPRSHGHWMPVGAPRVPAAAEQRRRGYLLLEE